jgi:tetratricopeptide (TPR) repeat protein
MRTLLALGAGGRSLSEAPRETNELPLSAAKRIDALCERFELAWQQAVAGGPRPRMEEFLSGARGAEPAALLRELVALEVAYRRRLGETPQGQEYRARFPDFDPAWLEQGLATSGPAPADSPASAGFNKDVQLEQDRQAVVDMVFAGYGLQGPIGCEQTTQLAVGPAPAPNKPLLLNEFDLAEVLGEGGMGKVYLVHSRLTGQSFAMKRTKWRTSAGQQQFLTELQTWLDLPEHPNLAACRFFRTVGNEVVVFAEYVAGGSLQAWIRDGKLRTVEQILDIAIQFAWGLAAAHACGLVHQDIKPANVLMTPDGRVKVTDFGLARGRAAEEETASGSATVLASWGGMTPAYCSPEQAEIAHLRQAGVPPDQCPKLTRRSDVWSWAISVLEAFVGKAPCPQGGQHAAEVFETFLREANGRDNRPRMPEALADLLRKCFRRDQAERWGSLTEIAEALRQLWRQTCGYDYWRAVPEMAARDDDEAIAADRYLFSGHEWEDPRPFLVRVYRAIGADPAQIDALLPPRTGSRRAQALADIAAYDETCRLVEEAMRGGQPGLGSTLARSCFLNAMVHGHAGDLQGAIALYDRAIVLYQQLLAADTRPEFISALAGAHINRAHALHSLRNFPAAITEYDRATALLEPLLQAEHRPEVAHSLAIALGNKAESHRMLLDAKTALACFDRAIYLYDGLVGQEWRPEIAKSLALVSVNKADLLRATGDYRGAVPVCDRGLALLERLINDEGHGQFRPFLAHAYRTKAVTLSEVDPGAALDVVARSIAVCEELINEGRHELTDQLALAFSTKAHVQARLRDYPGTIALHDQAIALYERLVNEEGRSDLRAQLAHVYLQQAGAVRFLIGSVDALRYSGRAVPLYERLVHQEGHRELTGELGWSKAERAMALGQLGRIQQAALDAREAVQLLQVEAGRTGQLQVQKWLELATKHLRPLLEKR